MFSRRISATPLMLFVPGSRTPQTTLRTRSGPVSIVLLPSFKCPNQPAPTNAPPEPAGDLACGEWEIVIPDAGTVLVLIEQTGGRYTSSVLLEDIASTIDGGLNPTAASLQNSIMGCGTHGGMIGVQWNSSNPIYKSAQYLATKAKPDNLIMKVVRGKE